MAIKPFKLANVAVLAAIGPTAVADSKMLKNLKVAIFKRTANFV